MLFVLMGFLAGIIGGLFGVGGGAFSAVTVRETGVPPKVHRDCRVRPSTTGR